MIGSALARILLVLFWTQICIAASPTPLPFLTPSPVVLPTSRPSVVPLREEPSLTAEEQSTLLREFTRAQYSEMKGLEHRYELEFDELKTSQKIRLKEWKNREQEARHKFWAEHEKGQEKRAYIQDYLERFKAFRKSLSDEKKLRLEEQKAHLLSLKKEQSTNYKEFRRLIDKKVRPPKTLWPAPGR